MSQKEIFTPIAYEKYLRVCGEYFWGTAGHVGANGDYALLTVPDHTNDFGKNLIFIE
jgi:hypothetical protein